RRRRAPLPGRALRTGRRQDPHPDRRQARLGRARHHRLPAPGPLRARSRGGRLPVCRHNGRAHRRPRQLRYARAAARRADEGGYMNATRRLHDAGQSLWLDNITRGLLTSGTLARYIKELSVTGLTSNPTIFDQAIKNSQDYDTAIREKTAAGKAGEQLFFELALEDLLKAADLFRPVHELTDRVDGWVSLEVSPKLAYDTATTLAAAKELSARAARPNLFIKIPGNREGVPAIEEAIFAGVPVNVTLLFSREHYVAAAQAYVRGIERRVAAGLNPHVGSVASIFVSRWDAA